MSLECGVRRQIRTWARQDRHCRCLHRRVRRAPVSLVHSFGILLVGSVPLSQKCRSFSPFLVKTTDSFVPDGKVGVWRIFVFVNQVQTSSSRRCERARTAHVQSRKLQATVRDQRRHESLTTRSPRSFSMSVMGLWHSVWCW